MRKLITDQPVNNHDDLHKVVNNILNDVGLKEEDCGGKITFAGLDPLRPTVLKVGASSAAIVTANSVATAAIWKMRSGEGQDIHADMRKTYVIQSPWQDGMQKYTMINGVSKMFSMNMYGTGAQILPTRDNRFVAICPAYPSQLLKLSDLLNSGYTPDQLQQASRKWDAADLESAAMSKMVPVHMIRTQKEFQETDHWKYHSSTPLIHLEKIGESDPEPLGPAKRPLSGIRALCMVHAVAGPSCPRQLAAQGADCLNINMPDWVENPSFFFQADIGLRQAYLDARKDANREKVYDLVKDADVFVENLRPGLAAKEGFSAEELAEHRPGIISVSVKLNTHTGPWSGWPGFDINAGAFCGVYTEEGTVEQPKFPHGVNVLCDIMTGYLGAIGVQAALLRRAKEGGSYRIHVSLAQCVTFMLSLGLVDKQTLGKLDSLGEEHRPQEPNLVTGKTPFGEFTRMASQIEMSKTPEYWNDPMIVVPGSGKAEWLPRETSQ